MTELEQALLAIEHDLLEAICSSERLAKKRNCNPHFNWQTHPSAPGETLAYIGLGWSLPGSGNGIHYLGGATLGDGSFLDWDSERKIGWSC
jgi:hypothetical protein